MDNKEIARRVLDAAFKEPRTQRSDKYKRGIQEGLIAYLEGTRKVVCPFRIGTAAADAFFFGVEEARPLCHLAQDMADRHNAQKTNKDGSQ